MSTRTGIDENDKDVTASEQNRESLKEYKKWFEKDKSICCTMLYYVHKDLVGEFKSYPTVEYIWGHLSITFYQIHSPLRADLRMVLPKSEKEQGQ